MVFVVVVMRAAFYTLLQVSGVRQLGGQGPMLGLEFWGGLCAGCHAEGERHTLLQLSDMQLLIRGDQGCLWGSSFVTVQRKQVVKTLS